MFLTHAHDITFSMIWSNWCINPLTPEDFYIFEWFAACTHPIGFCDSIFGVTMESAAVLGH